MRLINIIIFLSFLILIESCSDEKTSWDSQILIPLAQTELNISNIINDSVLKSNPDNSLTLTLNNNLLSIAADTLLKIPDTTIITRLSFPVKVTVPPGTLVFYKNETINLKLGETKLTKLNTYRGKIKYHIKSTVKAKTKFNYSLPKALSNGKNFEITEYIPAATSNSYGEFFGEYDISGYEFDLTGENSYSENSIQALTKVYLDSSALATPISTKDSIYVYLTFSDIIPSYALGYFGQITGEIGPSDTELDLFKNISAEIIDFEHIDFAIKISNYFGADTKISLTQLSASNSKTKKIVNLSSSIINKNINISRATNNNGTINPTKLNVSIESDAARDLIKILPDQISYNLSYNVNPLGNISGGNDFLYYGKGLNADIEISIPLVVNCKNFVMTDTTDFIFEEKNNPIKDAEFTIIAQNSFPFDANLKLYLLNIQNIIIDSIDFNTKITAAPIESNQMSSISKESKIKATLNQNTISKLNDIKSIIIKSTFNTEGNKFAKISSTNKLQIKLVSNFTYQNSY